MMLETRVRRPETFQETFLHKLKLRMLRGSFWKAAQLGRPNEKIFNERRAVITGSSFEPKVHRAQVLRPAIQSCNGFPGGVLQCAR